MSALRGGGDARRGSSPLGHVLAIGLALALAGQGVAAAPQSQHDSKPHESRQHDGKHREEKQQEAKTPEPPAATPAPPPDTRPYDPQLLRLSEILGALTYLRGVCNAGDADQWRARMQALLEAEGKPDGRRDRLAGAFNHGMQGYALSYRSCTPNARFVIQRFLAEGSDLARGLENRYRPG